MNIKGQPIRVGLFSYYVNRTYDTPDAGLHHAGLWIFGQRTLI